MQNSLIWRWGGVLSPLIGAAIHDGPKTRAALEPLFALDKTGRLREEDPFTAQMAEVLPRHLVGLNSRFEVDLNRPREKAVYQKPEDAWGLQVWKGELLPEIIEESHAFYDAFYADVEQELKTIEQAYGHFVVFDLHTYNHRRDGKDAPPASAQENPDVNIGTKSLVDPKFRPLIERLIFDLRGFDFGGRSLDVRENVKFGGGEFSQWIHRTFPDSACSLAIEWKKFWMDEWTGQADESQLKLIQLALKSTLDGAREELEKI